MVYSLQNHTIWGQILIIGTIIIIMKLNYVDDFELIFGNTGEMFLYLNSQFEFSLNWSETFNYSEFKD